MIGSITVKRGLKRAAGWAAVASAPLTSRPGPSDSRAACILMYHRIARIPFVDRRTDDWNVHPDVFDHHMRTLREAAEPVALHALAAKLREPRDTDSARPLVCVTFDDGYASVCEQALPVLERYAIPATFFIPTAFVNAIEPMPFDGWGQRHHADVDADLWRPLGWRDLERALRTPLVSIGSHSHRHLHGRECSASQLAEEAERSRDMLRSRLGAEQARTYAYPYGCSRLGDVPVEYEEAVRAADYDLAVTTDLGLATTEDNPLRLPRIEAHQVDTPSMLRAKIRGALAPYWITDHLRGLVH